MVYGLRLLLEKLHSQFIRAIAIIRPELHRELVDEDKGLYDFPGITLIEIVHINRMSINDPRYLDQRI